MKRGIVLFALGDPNYGKMAAALAASIKVVERTCPITVFHEGKAFDTLSTNEQRLFNDIMVLEKGAVTNKNGSFNPLKARMHAYELSPYYETLCIDVDNVWLGKKKVSDAFKELKNVSFTLQNSGYTTIDETADPRYSVWGDIHKVGRAYKIEGKKFYQTFGEWLWFKKDAVAKEVMDTAKKIFLDKPKTKIYNFIGQAVPDELAFSIAMAQTGIYPHQDRYLPTTYHDINSLGIHQFSHCYQLAEDYYTISMGGNRNPVQTVNNYNILVSAAYQKLGLQHPYQWKTKRSFLPERKTL